MCSGEEFKSRFLLFRVSPARPRLPSDPAILRALTSLTVPAALIVIAGHFEPAQGNPGGITNIFQPLSQPAQEIREVSPIFILASILPPFSPNLSVMLALQVIAGLSSGTFYPLTMSYALRSLPLRYSIYGIGVYSIDILAVTNIAVPLEGWFTNRLTWHWIFWFSALITPLMMLCIYRAIPHPPKRAGPKPSISWRGFLYASLGLSLIFGTLDQGQRLNWLESGVIVAMLATGGVLLVAAIIRRWMSPNPLLNIAFLNNRNTLILPAGLFSFRFLLLAVAILIPAFLGAIQGYRPLETGRVLLWMAVPQVVTGIIAAWLMHRFDGRLIIAIGFALVAIACLMNAQLTSTWAGDNFWASQLVIAVGLSFTFVALVGLLIQQGAFTGAFSRPIDMSLPIRLSFIWCVCLEARSVPHSCNGSLRSGSSFIQI